MYNFLSMAASLCHELIYVSAQGYVVEDLVANEQKAVNYCDERFNRVGQMDGINLDDRKVDIWAKLPKSNHTYLSKSKSEVEPLKEPNMKEALPVV